MDRNREARRGSMAAVNGGGGGLSRRRQQQRSSNLRDSPEDGAMEMQESSRLRDRGVKKDRDRDRSGSRSKRRRGERLMHGSNREEGDDTSEESVDDDDDDEEEDASVSVRLPPPANSPQIPSASSSIQQQQQQNRYHVRKSSFPTTKPVRPPMPSWNVTEEMIGVSIPRKARSSSVKRSQECWVSGGGSGELINRQASTSPARPSPSSNTAISPSSSNVSVRKKKLISGTKQRPPKIAKTSASSIQEDIEKEVAEVLFGMTRHAPPSSNKQDHNRVVDYKDMNGLSTEAKSRVSSPNSISQTPATSQPSALPIVATAPKRKRPQLKLDEGSPTSPASSVAPLTKTEPEIPPKAEEESSPKSEKNHRSASPAVENGHGSCDLSGPVDAQDLAKPESEEDQMEAKDVILKEEAANLPPKSEGASEFISVVATKASPANENPKEGKFSIDLMAPPLPEKPSSERDGHFDFGADKNSLGPGMKMLPANGDANKVETASKQHGTSSDHQNAGNFLSEDFNLKKQSLKDKIPDLQLNLEKHDKEGLSLSCSSKQQQQPLKQQQKTARIDPKQERPAPSASLPLPLPMAGWPGGFPPFGYIGQVPSLQAVVQMDAAAKAVQQPPHFLQPQGRPKRCATHCYIAQNIHYHQQMARLNPFWSPAAAAAAAAALNTAPLYGAKQYNLNAVPPLDSGAILGNPLQGGLPPRSSTPITMAFTSPPLQQSAANEKSSAAAATAAANGNAYLDPATQRKQFLIPPNSQPGSSMAPPNMIQGPAFLFPINQQQPGVANRPGVVPSKSSPVTGNAPPPPAANANSSSAASPSSATTMSFNYPGLSPTDAQAQYMAILQNSAACPFPIASPQVGGSTHYRGASPAQAMPFLNGPFYSSQMANPQQQQQLFQMQQEQLKQLQQQQSEQIRQLQQQKAHQNPSTSSGSSSSQKHTQHHHHHQQQQRVPTGAGAPPAGSNSQNFPVSKPQVQLLSRPENDTGCEDSPSTADSSTRVLSQARKGGIYGQNFAMPIRSQNFALISLAAAALTGGSGNSGSRGENKQQQQQHQGMKVDLTPSQAYAMSFASFGGSAAAAASASGLDFSAIVQNPALLQNMPEAARHGYQIPAAAIAAAAAAAQSAQHKKAHLEDGKSAAAANANRGTDDAKLAVSGGGKSVGQQHSLTFSRSDEGNTNVNVISNLGDASARALNHLHAPPNGARALNQPSSAPTLSAATNSPSSQHLTSSQSKQQYNQMIQFQQQQQRMMQQHQQQPMQMQQQMSRNVKPSSAARTSTNNNNISSTAMAAAAAGAARLPQGGVGVGGFPPSVIPVGGSSAGASNSPQWKPSSSSSSARTATAAPAASATSSSSSAKNQIPQQQQHTQISFGGVNTSSHKPLSSAAASAVDAAGSPQNSLAKTSAAATAAGGNNSNSGSPRASSSSKSGQPPASVLPTPLQHQQAAAAAVAALSKNSSPTAASTLKPSSSITNNSNNRNNSSILGHPNITPSSNSITKKLQQQQQQQQQQSQQQQQQQQHHLPKQPFQQSQQPFFNNPYIQAQTSQRRLSEQQQQQQPPQNPATSGMLSLSASSDPTKSAAAAANNAKGLTTTQTQAGILHQHTAQYAVASMAPHPFMSSFPYIHSMQSSSVSVKPSSAATPDQKQSTAGNENVHACWKQPEKR